MVLGPCVKKKRRCAGLRGRPRFGGHSNRCSGVDSRPESGTSRRCYDPRRAVRAEHGDESGAEAGGSAKQDQHSTPTRKRRTRSCRSGASGRRRAGLVSGRRLRRPGRSRRRSWLGYRSLDRLRQFWDRVSSAAPLIPPSAFDPMRPAFNRLSAAGAATFGVPGFFSPRLPPPFLAWDPSGGSDPMKYVFNPGVDDRVGAVTLAALSGELQ